ncbi:metallophosphoesterase [soil metagenome]
MKSRTSDSGKEHAKKYFYRSIFIILIYFFLNPAQAQDQQLPSEKPFYTLFLIGDAGEPKLLEKDPNLALLENHLLEAGQESGIVFLGDNIYPRGLPGINHRSRTFAERLLTEQLDILKNYKGSIVFIPGNHDWDKSGREGWQRIRNQEKFIEDYLQRGNVFLPDGGCPGPVELNLNDSITLVVMDTQWMLHPWEKPGPESDCPENNILNVLAQFEDVLERNKDRKVVVATHHPVYSAGEHGGHNSWKDHLFPFTNLNKSLYIPMPVIGSIYPLYRKWFGDVQDLPHPKNRVMRKSINSLLKEYPGIIHAAGHEHALQYYSKDEVNYVVSGSGSKMTPVKKNHDADFAKEIKGFAQIKYFKNGEVWLEFLSPDAKDLIVYRKRLSAERFINSQETVQERTINFKDSVAIVPASTQYRADPLKKWFLGSNYRAEWSQPIPMSAFDLGSAEGGLEILKLGGGMQTRSLHLKDQQGRQYKLRSIEKYAENAIPDVFKGIFAADLIQDQISASHPYGALIIPEMAKKAGIYHTNPRLFFIPDDPRFGKYRKSFANTVGLFEIKPDEDLSSFDNFGNSKNIVGTQKVLDMLYEDNDNSVDQLSVLRARIFDLLIGDWDRHDGQWRWASFKKKGKGTYYKPIPQDRDQAFFKNEGFLPKIVSRKWIMPKFQGFDEKVRDVAGFMHNARFFDRTFLNEPSLEEWKAMADSITMQLTDEVIENAIKQWPGEIYELSGEEIIHKLKARKEILASEAEKYYRFLAKEVDVTGSNKHEFFKVQRLNDEETLVEVFKLTNEGETGKPLFKRIFTTSQTDEIRLFGLDGDDIFEITGAVKKGPLIRIIGGLGTDELRDHSIVSGPGKKVYYYDDLKDNVITSATDSRLLISNSPGVNEYNRRSFEYNYLGPLLSINYNPDDGIFLGGGVLIRRHGFRKEPYAAKHIISANYSLATSSYNFRYSGDFIGALGSWNLQPNLNIMAPNFVNNFFGLGNESVYEKEREIDYYRVRFENVVGNVLLQRKIANHQNFYFGPTYQSFEVYNTAGRHISQYNGNQTDTSRLFSRKHYGGFNIGYVHEKRDDLVLPTEGFYIRISSDQLWGLNPAASNFSNITSEMAYYWSFRIPSVITLATRIGGGINFGSYEFFQANTLGGLTNLRGYRRTRFSGESSLYNNTEIRLKLFSFKTYIFPGYLGLLAFNDVGRVWLEGEDSQKWHWGYGGGIWVSPFTKFVVSFMYSFSEEDDLPLIKFGFFF